MNQAPSFFVPAATAENQESVYAEFARRCSAPAPPLEQRIYSITFGHDGEVWTAAVGETLYGIRTKKTKSKGKTIERELAVSDPATVLAIFAGSPYQVVTNQGIGGSVGSKWANPFLAGQPRSVQHFTTPK